MHRLCTWILLIVTCPAWAAADSVAISLDPATSPRVDYGADRLAAALKTAGIDSQIQRARAQGQQIIVCKLFAPNCPIPGIAGAMPGPEGFLLESYSESKMTVVAGIDDSGELYGCLELAQRIQQAKKIPTDLHISDGPAFKLRGPCIGMQKSTILPGRHTYEYPYTPDLFPFFYDKKFWQEYLDFLADNRMNTLFIWSGHPFASLVRLKDYPFAVEVSDDVFQKNVEMFRYIVTEADRRGIWVVQNFYNILVSKPFADHYGIDTQLSAPTPLTADYTRKSIAEFIRQYPNVGLMFCLGEKLQGLDNQVYWCTQVILPGVKDGMAEAHLAQEPPVIIRTHATDLTVVMPEALKVYKNLFTEEKFNGESLTTDQPRGVRQQLHLAMSKLASTHVANIHILANLEPFRYGDVRFIKQCVIAARDRLGAKGIHLYPLSYWNWPDSPDLTDTPLEQWKRDWIWFDAWARYAWNPNIDAATDHAWWISQIADRYGSAAAENILAAYNDFGECALRLLRRFGITEGNRQTLSLGMTLDELVNPQRHNPFPELWESQSPPGERMAEYVQKEWNHQPHEGETPPSIIHDVLDFSAKAVAEIDSAAADVSKNRDEFDRLRNDIYCVRAMSQSYCAKAQAAMLILRFRYSNDASDMLKARVFLAQSLDYYRRLAKLADGAYHFANSMQTGGRQIPLSGASHGKPMYYLWSQMLPVYEKELADFQQNVASLQHGPTTAPAAHPLIAAPFTLLSKDAQTYSVTPGEKVFTDQPFTIQSVSPQLQGLTGIRISHDQAVAGKLPPIEFQSAQPVRVLIGFFQSPDKTWLQVPHVETDAAAAEKFSAEALVTNAVSIPSLPSVDVYAQSYDAGRHQLEVRGSGSFVILGFIKP